MGVQLATEMPIERAVPATWRLAISRSSVLRSGILVARGYDSSARLVLSPDGSSAVWEPLAMPAA